MRVGLLGDDRDVLEGLASTLSEAGERAEVIGPPADADPDAGLDAYVAFGTLTERHESVVGLARVRLPQALLVACAPAAQSRLVRWALENAADAVVWLDQAEDCLVPALYSVRAGLLVMPREARRRLQAPELTTREKQVLSLVVMGLTNGEIGQKLYVTEATVKSHLGTAFRKLGVSSRSEASRLITDPTHGLGTGILAITAPAPRRR